MIKNRNMHRDAKKHVFSHVMKLVAADNQSIAILDSECDTRLLRVDTVFNLANNPTNTQNIQVGTIASPNLYVNYAVADSQAAGFQVNHVLASSAIIPKGTPLIVKKSSAASDAGSIAELTVQIVTDRIDNADLK